VSQSFDWTWLRLPRWTPLSALGTRADRLIGGLYAVAPGMYALTNAAWGSPEDPGLGGFLWARSSAVARLIYDCKAGPIEHEGAQSAPPPTDVLGFTELTYAGVLTHARARGDRPQASASYAFPMGGSS